MKFTEKYEIIELLTSGRVSTFLARDRSTQAQAVVHTFECPANFAIDARGSSILNHFASLAPSPAETVTETGFDDGTSSAYIVTPVPAPSVLQAWVRSYRSFSAGERSAASAPDENATAELSAAEVERLLRQSGRAKNQRPVESPPAISTESFSVSPPADTSQPKGEFTRLFEDPGAFQRLTGKGAPEISAPAVPKELMSGRPLATPTNFSEAPPSTNDLSESPPQPGSFPQDFFSSVDDVSNPRGFGGAPVQEPSGAKEPGAFTKEFLAISGKDPQSAKPPEEQRASWQEPTAKTSSPTPAFGNMFQPVTPSSRNLAERSGSPEVLKGSTGEFTSFFRGPFDQPTPAEKPIEYPDPVQSPPSRAGDFTQIFGDENRLNAKESPSTAPPERPQSTVPSFTQIFSEDAKGGARLGDLKRDTNPRASETSKPLLGSTANPSPPPPMFSSTVSPVSPRAASFPPAEPVRSPSGSDNTFLSQAGRSDATRAFQPRGADAPLVEPEAPSGPSDFTMFISSSQLRASLPPQAPPNPAGSNPAMRPPAVAMPAMPSYAPPAPPPMPPPPQMVVPKAPQVPRPPAAPAPASYWPLITVLTVLFAVAALLVMYFALKH